VRQHLEALEAAGLVSRTATAPAGRGRPPVTWLLTDLAGELFPDRHADLTVELVEAVRTSLGDEALDRVLSARAEHQIASYRRLLGSSAAVPVRVRKLAAQRSLEGYLAEVVADGDDLVLVEHHCPIADAAHACAGLCAKELETFRAALGDDVEVERTQHLISGDTRCAYRIRRRAA
jgi:predicted ArsR family transcriptional regulator